MKTKKHAPADNSPVEHDVRHAVSIEICHIIERAKANELAKLIKDRLNDIDEDIYICVSEYSQVKKCKMRISA